MIDSSYFRYSALQKFNFLLETFNVYVLKIKRESRFK